MLPKKPVGPMNSPFPHRPSVFQFLDAREYLRQAYAAEKQVNKGFSHRYIAKAMGAGSSSFFKDVLNGRAPLNPARAAKFARLLCMPPEEAEYFQNLVLYTQAEDAEERERLLKNLTETPAAGVHRVLEASQAEYLQKWYYAAVRELLAVMDFRGDYEELAARLDPPITSGEARMAIELLLRLGLARKTVHGRFEKTDRVVVTGRGADARLARQGILENLELARRAFDVHPPAARPFSYLTVSVSRETLQFIENRLQAVRREILNRVGRDAHVDRLYQINMQVFPISRSSGAVAAARRAHNVPSQPGTEDDA